MRRNQRIAWMWFGAAVACLLVAIIAANDDLRSMFVALGFVSLLMAEVSDRRKGRRQA